MTQWHMKSYRKASGGIKHSLERCTKKLAWKGGNITNTTLGKEQEVISGRSRGGNEKQRLKVAKYANVALGNGRVKKAEIISVDENAADRQFARRNIITKGAVITVALGGEKLKAKVTSRPGNSSAVNAIALKAGEAKKAEKYPKAEKSEEKTSEKPKTTKK